MITHYRPAMPADRYSVMTRHSIKNTTDQIQLTGRTSMFQNLGVYTRSYNIILILIRKIYSNINSIVLNISQTIYYQHCTFRWKYKLFIEKQKNKRHPDKNAP